MRSQFVYCQYKLLRLPLSLVHSLSAQTLSYDLGGRLTGVTYTNGIQVKYTYDVAGNISAISTSSVQNTNPPVVAIVNPLPGNAPTTTPPTFSGTASGSNQVIAVFYQVNNGAFQIANAIHGWANWTASMPFMLGANTVKFYAVDSAGNVGNISSETVSVSGPELQAVLTNGSVTLSWPNWASGYSVQSTPTLGPGAVWSPENANLSMAGGYFALSMPSSDVARFFRLVDIPAGLVAYWQFNNATNLGADSSGQSNTLITATGGPAYSSDGKFGGALFLDGNSTLATQSGTFPNGVPVGSSPYTIGVWEKADSGCQNNGGFFGWGYNYSGQANNLRLNGPNGVNDYWWGNDFTLSGLAANPMDGNWHAIVVTWDGTTQTFYVDGVSVGTRMPSPPNVQPANFIVGKTTGDVNFKGWIEDLMIANTVLSPAQITSYPNWGTLVYTVSQ